MNRVVSATVMVAELGIERRTALLIRRIARAVDDRPELEKLIEKNCPRTWGDVPKHYHDPFSGRGWRVTMALRAIDELLETCGVEALGPVDMHAGPPYEYCNAGDPYVATLIYTRDTDTLRVGSWGDIAEKHPAW